MSKTRPRRYSASTRNLHWLAAILLALAFVLGLTMKALDPGAAKLTVYRVHAAIGTAILLVTLARLYLAFRHPRPGPSADWPRWMRLSSAAVHWGLYLLPFLLIINGLGMTVLTPIGAMAFLGGPGEWPVMTEFPPALGHYAASRLLAGAVLLHVAAALYHQFWRRDRLFDRIGVGPASTENATQTKSRA